MARERAAQAELARDTAAKAIQAALAAKATRSKPALRSPRSSLVSDSTRESAIFWALLMLAVAPALVALTLHLTTASPRPTAPVAAAAFRKVCLWDVGKFCLKLPVKGSH